MSTCMKACIAEHLWYEVMGYYASVKLLSDRRKRVVYKGGGQKGEYEVGRIVVNTQWHALQLMSEARGHLLTTQR